MNPEGSLERRVSLRSACPEMEYGNRLHAAMRSIKRPQRESYPTVDVRHVGKATFPQGPRPDAAPRKDQKNCCKGPDNTARREAVVLMFSKDNGSYLPKFWPLDPQLADAMRYAVLLLPKIKCEVTSGTIRPTAEHHAI